MPQHQPAPPPPDLDPDEEPEPADELLHLRQAELLAILAALRGAPGLDGLRQQLSRLKERVRSQDAALLGAPGATCIEVNRPYFFGALEQIAATHTMERAIYYVARLVRGLTEVRSSAVNDLNLNRWQQYGDILTDSLWMIERRDSSGAHSAGYWGNFIPQIPNQMMRRYTRQGEWVLDVFAGSGTTLIEGQRLGRNTLGSELQGAIAAQTRQRIASEPNTFNVVSEVIEGDSALLDYEAALRAHGQRSVQLVLAHPPYFDIIKFSADPQDLSNAESVEHFLARMGQVIDNAARVLDRGRYFILVIGDKYVKEEWIPLGFRTMNEVLRRGFTLKSIVVKNFEETAGKRTQKELWRYRALAGGFYVFKHEYIFIFKKQ